MRKMWKAGVLLIAALCAWCGEPEALAISTQIQTRHLPFGTILDPFYLSAESEQITGYTRCGDSALWTGHYLAAEAYRYRVTGAAEALANAGRAVEGLKGLVDVTGTGLLARCRVGIGSPFANGIHSEEAANGVYINNAAGYTWIGNTSRDQYCGVIYGLGTAYSLIPQEATRETIRDVVTRMVAFLMDNNWSAPMPDGKAGTTFLLRPDEQLAILQVARLVNEEKFGAVYEAQRSRLAGSVSTPVAFDSLSTSSYFKFNLIFITFFHLIRLEEEATRGTYERAYSIARNYTAGHQNAFFNMIDAALFGPDARRDAETLALLDLWLKRPRRDQFVDLRGKVPVCGDQACTPVPVDQRTPTDFLWQRSPFQLFGGGTGTIGNAGIDYILPYWMARYYGLIGDFAVQSAASSVAGVAPDSIVSLYGGGLVRPGAGQDVQLQVTDAEGVARQAELLFVSPTQINAVVPGGTAVGQANFRVVTASVLVKNGMADVRRVAPALFTMNGRVAAATAVRIVGGAQMPVEVFACSAAGCTATPIDTSAGPVYLSLYGTALRRARNSTATIGGRSVPVLYAGEQPAFPGLDQVNVELPAGLRGEVEIVFSADGARANSVFVALR